MLVDRWELDTARVRPSTWRLKAWLATSKSRWPEILVFRARRWARLVQDRYGKNSQAVRLREERDPGVQLRTSIQASFLFSRNFRHRIRHSTRNSTLEWSEGTAQELDLEFGWNGGIRRALNLEDWSHGDQDSMIFRD